MEVVNLWDTKGTIFVGCLLANFCFILIHSMIPKLKFNPFQNSIYLSILVANFCIIFFSFSETKNLITHPTGKKKEYKNLIFILQDFTCKIRWTFIMCENRGVFELAGRGLVYWQIHIPQLNPNHLINGVEKLNPNLTRLINEYVVSTRLQPILNQKIDDGNYKLRFSVF